MDQILEKKENINELQISSEQKAEIFKYSREEKFRVLKYIENYKSILKPLITHSKNGIEKDLPQDATFFNM